MENSFVKYIKENIDVVNKEMNDVLKNYNLRIKEQINDKDKSFNAFLGASEGGKRIRAILVKLGYELYEGKDVDSIVAPSISFEIIQTGLLIHDDIIDKSPIRRNKPSVYMELGGDHQAISKAICLGDLAYPLSNMLISKSNFNEKYKIKAVEVFNNSVFNTIIGQMQDIDFGENSEQSEKEVLSMNVHKTAYYTIIGPLQVGAILAGANEETLKILDEFGRMAGIMFQIQDDVLGIFGDEKTIGKSVTSDIKEGKSTILSTYTYSKMDELKKHKFNEIYGSNAEITMAEVEYIREIMLETGSLDYAKEKMEYYYNKAKSIIPEITKNEEKIELLTDFLNYLIKREK